MKQNRFLVRGTDRRQKYLAAMLREEGHFATFDTEKESEPFDAILLPLSETNQYREECEQRRKKGQLIFGTNFDETWTDLCDKQEVRLVDYRKEENVAWQNAIATAEGAIAEALKEGGETIYGSRCIVSGYGRCGEVLAHRLVALGAVVTVLERKKEKRAQARCLTPSVYDFSQIPKAVLTTQNYLFNTVPAPVINCRMISRMNTQAVILDLASRPGGVDFSCCRKRKINAKLCPGLPGIYAPKTSARILLEVIGNEMW